MTLQLLFGVTILVHLIMGLKRPLDATRMTMNIVVITVVAAVWWGLYHAGHL